MGTYPAPTKEEVRAYLKRRFGSTGPVPSPPEIRATLGWGCHAEQQGQAVTQGDAASERKDGSE